MTGSLIALSPNDVSIAPITSVSAASITKVGAVRVEDALQNMPQFTASQNSGESIGSNGTASVNLYGLGQVRTLVLLNGRRMGPGGGSGTTSSNVPDITQIPAALIQRIDVLTGGASSTYGADAVAGAVNFVLDTHFTGVKIDGTYSFNQHNNDDQADLTLLRNFGAALPPSSVNTGANRDISIILGSDFADGKGNATGYFTFTSTSPAVGSQFDHAGCTIIGGSTKTGPLKCGGSETMATGAFIETGLVNGSPSTLVSDTIDSKTGLMRPIQASDLYNYGATSYFQRSLKRYTGGAFVHYNLSDNAQVYSETMWANIETLAQYGPSADFFSPANISCSNPLLTAQELSVLCNPTNLAANHAYAAGTLHLNLSPGEIHLYIGRRDVEGGPRVDDYVSNSFREVLGVQGALGNAWSYDAWAMASNAVLQFNHDNNLGDIQIQNALNAVPDPNNPSQAVCASTLTVSTLPTDTGCVPWNIFTPGGVNQQQLNYLIIPAGETTTAREYMAQATVNGDLGQYGFKLPTAGSGVKVAFGMDWREDWFDQAPTFVSQFGLTSGDSPIPAEYGNFNLWEAFTEARIPLIDDKPFLNRLEADLAYRYSSYNLGFNTSTYKLGLVWAPINSIRFRVGYNRAVRAPNIDELFAGDTIGAGGVSDPCWGATPALSQAQCALTGVTAAEYGHLAVNPAAQINTETGGNVHLNPEIADTYTFGVVFRPAAIPNLSASLDYYDISIRDTIEQLSSSTVVQGCATGTSAFCSLIHRGPNGSLWQNIQTEYVVTTEQNIGKLSTKGADLSVQYSLGVGAMGRMNLGVTGTWVKELINQPTPSLSSAYDCAGFYGATCAGNAGIGNGPIPHWRHVFTASWETPWREVALNLRWRYIGPTQNDGLSYNPNLSGDGYYTAADHISSYDYIDLSADVPVTKGVTATLGVNNIADKNPPLVPSGSFSACPSVGCNDNTWPGMYDTMGRYIFLHVEAKF